MTIFVGSSNNIQGEIRDYPSLSQAIQDYWARSDLTTFLPYLVQAAENAIYNDIFARNNGRGTADIEATFSGSTGASGTCPLPTNYLALRNAQINFNGSAYPLQRKNAEFIFVNYPQQSGQGMPAFIARQGSSFIFGPFPDTSYTLQGIYWARDSALSVSNATTWMTDKIPNILFAACCIEGAKFTKDPEAAQIWQGIYDQALDAYLKRDAAEMWSGSALAMTAA